MAENGERDGQRFSDLGTGDCWIPVADKDKRPPERRIHVKLDKEYQSTDGQTKNGNTAIIAGPRELRGKVFHVPKETPVIKI